VKSGGDVLLRRKRGLRMRAGSMPCIRLRSLIVAFDVCRHWDSSTRRRLVRRSTGSLSLVWCKWSLARIKSNCGIVVSYLSLICPTNHPARSQQLLDVCQRTKSPWCCTRASRRSDRSWCVHIYFSVSNVLLFVSLPVSRRHQQQTTKPRFRRHSHCRLGSFFIVCVSFRLRTKLFCLASWVILTERHIWSINWHIPNCGISDCASCLNISL